jgi:phosphoglycerate kinase
VSAIHDHFQEPGTAAAGLLLSKELLALDRILVEPARPFVAVMGGLKVSDKIGTIRRLMDTADKILIGVSFVSASSAFR